MILAAIPLCLVLLQGEAAGLPGHSKTADPPHWYEQVTGILGIPTAIIAGAYAYLLIHKTRLESRKLELEIAEKSQSPAPATSTLETHPEPSVSTEAVTATLVNRRFTIFLLRYVLLQLALDIYRGLTAPLHWAGSLAVAGLSMISGGFLLSGGNGALIIGTQTLGSLLIEIGYWLVFLLLGWPLFKDVNEALGIRLKEYTPRALWRSLRSSRSK